jgi:hypothetical protein
MVMTVMSESELMAIWRNMRHKNVRCRHPLPQHIPSQPRAHAGAGAVGGGYRRTGDLEKVRKDEV